MRVGGSSGGGSGSGGSSDENKRLGRPHDSGEQMDRGHNEETLDLDLAWVQWVTSVIGQCTLHSLHTSLRPDFAHQLDGWQT